ncbi:MAG: 2-C-methyl-D-erythritol 4-phosphate cytidylyltransferase [Actinobacteria bacterium]|nr:MAG: 2-C-methyl-D-erythritol 4-phosphate cytidylyltransferase [Actinomycetota bacterium]
MSVTTWPNEIIWTIIVAAGSGARFGSPKQFTMLGDRRVVDWSIATASAVSAGVVVVLPPGEALTDGQVAGGETRSESVRCGLQAVPLEATIICVHDAARPFATEHLFRETIAQVHMGADGAVPAIGVTDTIKQVDAQNVVVNTPDRSSLVAVQTPQVFRASILRQAHAGCPEGTDDATLVELLGKRVVVVAGEALNRKLTAPEDLEWARAAARTEV